MKAGLGRVLAMGLTTAALLGLLVPKRVYLLSRSDWNTWQVVENRESCPTAGNVFLQIVKLNAGYACIGNADDDWVHWYIYIDASRLRPVYDQILRPSALDLGDSRGVLCKAHAFVFFWGTEEGLRKVDGSPADRLRLRSPSCAR